MFLDKLLQTLFADFLCRAMVFLFKKKSLNIKDKFSKTLACSRNIANVNYTEKPRMYSVILLKSS